MNKVHDPFMELAYEEACISLKEGNCGFGAVIINKNNEVIAEAHDTEMTDDDSTSHAEINAIKIASKIMGHDLDDCIIFSTHEPCPMCASAILWSGIQTIVYGYSIADALKEGRRRIDISCSEIFSRAGKKAVILDNVLHDKCALLYKKDIRNEIKRIWNKNHDELQVIGEVVKQKRIKWFDEKFEKIDDGTNLLDAGYHLLLSKLEISPEEAPIVERDDTKIVFHSMNYCPTLEACKILGYDTRIVCKALLEDATDILLKQLDKRLSFNRNYKKMRPYCDYCEEMILFSE